jgi:hypothetical protein
MNKILSTFTLSAALMVVAAFVHPALPQVPNGGAPMIPNGGGGGSGGTPGGTSGQVQYNNSGAFGGLTNAQLTALINTATASLSGALPAWPNNTTTFFRGDGTYATAVTSIATGPGATGGTCTTTCTIQTQKTDVVLTTASPAISAAGSNAASAIFLTNASADTPTIPGAGTTGYPAGWFLPAVCNTQAFAKTITPASGTIGGAATKVLAAGTDLVPTCISIESDGVSNYRISSVSASVSASPGTVIGTSTITGGTTLRVLYDNAGVFGEYTNAQLTALINAATASLPGALPAWPNNTTTFFRGDGTYATLNCAALSDSTGSCSAPLPLSGANGGTGVANTGKTVTLGASLTTTGAGAPTLAFPGSSGTTTFPTPTDTVAELGTANTFTAANAFTTISASGQITSTATTGTAPLVIASTTNVPNLNASSLSGATFAAPGAIGGGTAAAGTFTTLQANTDFLTAGTTFPTQAAGQTVVTGLISAPSLTTVGGQAVFYNTAAGGATLQGFGSTNDVVVANKAGTIVMRIATGTTTATFQGPLSAGGVFLDLFNTGAAATSSIQNSSANAAASNIFGVGNNTSSTEFNITVLSSAAGTPNQATINSAGPMVGAVNGTNWLTVSTAQLVTLPAITSDAGLTDANVCEDTTLHGLHAGSGTLGVCLGTSSKRYKNRIVDLSDGLAQIMALEPKNFFYNPDHGDYGAREQYGFLAEDVVDILPKLTALDSDGKPNSVDILGMVPILVKAMQEQQAKIAALETRLVEIEDPNRGAIMKGSLHPYSPTQGNQIMPVSAH